MADTVRINQESIEYLDSGEYEKAVADMQSRIQASRLRKFAGKRERTFTVHLAICDVLGGTRYETRKIKGFTLEDAKEQAGIS